AGSRLPAMKGLAGDRTAVRDLPRGGTALNRKEEALWLFQRLAPEVAVDNLPLAIRTSARLDPSTLEAAARAVLRRHPALRTRFPARHGVPRRQIVSPDEAVVPVASVAIPADRLAGTLTELALRPFDLTRDLPFRLFRIALDEGGDVLCLVSHHIVFDGASGGVVMPELAATYQRLAGGDPLTPEPAAPALTEDPPSSDSVRYWLDALAGIEVTRLALPAARLEPAHPTFA